MLILRIRQAETAMADGRLDEAFEIVRGRDVRSHRRAQDLIGRLVRAFVDRAREHLREGRLPQAALDGEKATDLGGNLPEVASLRAAIANAMSCDQHSRRRKTDAVAAARRHVDEGRLSIGQGFLEHLPDDAKEARGLAQEIDARRDLAVAALGRGQAAIARQDWPAAIDAMIEARQAHASNEQVVQGIAGLTEAVNRQIRTDIQRGRLDLAELLLNKLMSLSDQAIETQEHRRILADCRRAGADVAGGRVAEALGTLNRLATILPECDWVRKSLAAAQQVHDGFSQLTGGPLGMLSGARVELGRTLPIDALQAPAPSPHAAADPVGQVDRLPRRFLIHIDGVGSYLVLRDRQITIGPASSSQQPDLTLMARSELPPISIERIDEDYFLSSRSGVRINDKSVTRGLLNHGDTISLSERARLRFEQPHPASTSAVLDLLGTRLPTGDVRRVILMDKDIVIGPAASAHIRASQLAEPVVLSIRNDRLCCGGGAARTALPLGRQVRLDSMAFVVTTA